MAQNQYTCEAFSATFNTEAELERHNRTIHSQYKCELAGGNLPLGKRVGGSQARHASEAVERSKRSVGEGLR